MLVWAVSMGTMEEEGVDDICVAIRGSKVQWSASGGTDDGGGGISVLII